MRFLAALFAAAALLSVNLQASGQAGRRAPGFSLPDRNQKQHDLYDYRGKVVVLDIIQTACPACQKFTRISEKLKQKYGERVAILSIVTLPDNLNTVRKFIATFNVTTPVLFDCGQAAASYVQATPDKPNVHMPQLFLIDQNGIIQRHYEHSADTKEVFEGDGSLLMREIDKLLSATRPVKAD